MFSLLPKAKRCFSDLGDLFSEDNEAGSSNKTNRQTSTSTSGYMSIPRPPSRRSDPSKNLISQNTISRTDSINSLEFRTACVPVGASRGPSPLTIGMADTIPLAVAFHEMVHSYFRGADETRFDSICNFSTFFLICCYLVIWDGVIEMSLKVGGIFGSTRS